eukprot:scaffold2.g7058.t1
MVRPWGPMVRLSTSSSMHWQPRLAGMRIMHRARHIAARRAPAPPRASDNAGGTGSGGDELPMRVLPPPAILERTRQQGRLQGNSSSSLASSDGDAEGQAPPPRNFLQRLALSLSGVLAMVLDRLFPESARRMWTAGFGRRLLSVVLMFLLGAGLSLATHARSRTIRGPQEVMYSEFLSLLDQGSVRTARLDDSGSRLMFDLHPSVSEDASTAEAVAEAQGSSSKAASTSGGWAAMADSPAARLQRALSGGRGAAGHESISGRVQLLGPVPQQYYTKRVVDHQLLQRLIAAGVEFGAVKQTVTGALVRVVGTALVLWIPLLPLYFVFKRVLDGRSGGSKRRKGDSRAEVPPTTFDDVAGVGAAKEELREVVACLKSSARFARLGAKMPSGVLLSGPPGTGKTLLARAVAGEAGVPFLAVSASEFVELFVGRGAARIRRACILGGGRGAHRHCAPTSAPVAASPRLEYAGRRELFAEARKRAPCVVFIDELDAVGGKRGVGLNEERDQTLNQLLTELDGFEGRPGVMLLAATNRPHVVVPLPDEEGRADILAVHMRAVPMASPQERAAACQAIARLTTGFNGAELANVVNEAAFLAVRRDGMYVAMADLAEAVSRTRYGVNGGPGLSLASGLQKQLQGWLAGAVGGTGKTMLTQPSPS